MKKELQEKLVEILTQIQSATGKAADFAVDQLPDIVQQFLLHGRIIETTYFIALLVLSLLMAWIALFKGFLVNTDKWSEVRGIAAMAGTLGTLFSLVMMFAQAKSFLMVWFAPKVWLIQEFSKLIR